MRGGDLCLLTHGTLIKGLALWSTNPGKHDLAESLKLLGVYKKVSCVSRYAQKRAETTADSHVLPESDNICCLHCAYYLCHSHVPVPYRHGL